MNYLLQIIYQKIILKLITLLKNSHIVIILSKTLFLVNLYDPLKEIVKSQNRKFNPIGSK